MIWLFFWIVAVLCLVGSSLFAYILGRSKYKKGRLLQPFNVFFVGVVLSCVVLFLPIYMNVFESGKTGVFETLFISVHNMIRLFVVDGDFDFITENIDELSGQMYTAYSCLFSVLFVLAPLMTFGFVLSFFKNLSAHRKYLTHFFSDVYVFSELNEKSLMLAVSLYEADRKHRLFVFTDVFETDEEEIYELIERSKEIGAIRFKKDIAAINFSIHSKKKTLNFFTIGEDQSENISQSLKLISSYKHRDNTNLFVFSTQIEAEMLLANVFITASEKHEEPIRMKVRRINEVQSLVLRNLYHRGYETVFQSAQTESDGTKTISAVVVGMGQHGTEMVKALSWFCQMDGYRAYIHAFDADEFAEETFCSHCPELMDPRYNGHFEYEDDARYAIKIYPKVNVMTKTFDDLLHTLPQVTYVFVSLGSDEKNIFAAVKLRALFERIGWKPTIQAVVHNSDKAKALGGVRNHSNQPYDIEFIGDRQSSYSEEVILGTEVEKKALARHMMWGSEEEFWQYDYNYKSSVASAIHKEMKIRCGIPGAEKEPKDRTQEELWAIRVLEHSRWNAYMRSEGYVHSGSLEKSTRNNLAKTHHLLVPFWKLPEKEQEKDDD